MSLVGTSLESARLLSNDDSRDVFDDACVEPYRNRGFRVHVGTYRLPERPTALYTVVALGAGFGVLTRSRAVVFLVVPLVSWSYFIVFEALFGQPTGKRLFGVVGKELECAPCGWLASFLRSFFRSIDGVGGYVVGLAAMLLSERRQRIGDRTARTVVVRAEGQKSVLSRSPSVLTASGRNG